MRRTSAITLAGVTALALTVSACGREDAGSATAETGKAVSSGAAKGTKGEVAVTTSAVKVSVDLPFMLRVMKGTIEEKIKEKLATIA